MDLAFYYISIAKTHFEKTVNLICFMRLISLEVALYLFKSTILFCMKYFCNVWVDSPSCYLELLDNLQRWSCRTVGLLFDTLADRRNVARLSFFYRYHFERCLSELAQLFLLPYSRGKSNRYPNRLDTFPVTIPRCYKDFYVNSFFPHTSWLSNNLPMQCFPLIYGLNVFKSRIERHY